MRPPQTNRTYKHNVPTKAEMEFSIVEPFSVRPHHKSQPFLNINPEDFNSTIRRYY